ncbi:MAG: DUF4258 domain-containing protein [Planctomycetes bacterium]|nr:DUF4258 domain-containing protein [Planctomycetota bacterium]
MKRQELRQVLRVIKGRVRVNMFTYTQFAFESMVDQSIYEEDVKRAVATGRLVETREDDRRGTHYLLQGFAMNEEEMLLICRLLRRKVVVAALHWA